MNDSKDKFLNKKAVIFDLDGTLLDSFSVHYKVFEIVFAKFGIQLEKEKFLETYSPNWYKTYKAFGLPKEKWNIVDNLWVEEAKNKRTKIFSGTMQLLNDLYDNFTLAIVTSGSKSRVEKDIKNNNIYYFFEIIITGDDIENSKPHPEGLELALEKLNLKSKDVVYVGDANDDYKMAKSAGIDFVGIRSDFANLSKKYSRYDLCNITELPTILGL